VKGEGWMLAVAMTLPTTAAATYFMALSPPAAAGGSEPDPLLQAAYFGSKVLLFLLPVLWLAFADRAALRTFPLRRRGVIAGLGFGIAAASFIFVLYFGWLADSPTFDGLADRVRAKVAQFGAATPARFVAFGAFIAVLHSLFEEYYWRWFVYGRLRRHLPQLAAMLLAGLAFMGHHVVILGVYFPGRFWPAVLPFSLGVALGGVAWAWLYERSGSLLGPWLSHLLVDAAIIAVGYHLIFQTPATPH
jgi:membrane protease YdiL (CAAX protease family)